MAYPIGTGLAAASGIGSGLRDASQTIMEALLRRWQMEAQQRQKDKALAAQTTEKDRDFAFRKAELERQVGTGYKGFDFGVPGAETFKMPPVTSPGMERYERFSDVKTPEALRIGEDSRPFAAQPEGVRARTPEEADTARRGAIQQAAVQYLKPYAKSVPELGLSPEAMALYATGSQPQEPQVNIYRREGPGFEKGSAFPAGYDPARTRLIGGLFQLMAQSGTQRVKRADIAARVRASAAGRFPPPSAEEVEQEVQNTLALLPPAADYGLEDIAAIAQAFGIPLNIPMPPPGGGQGAPRPNPAAVGDDFFSP